MNEAAFLMQLEQYARQIRESAELILQAPPETLDGPTRAAVERIARLARETEEKACSPVHIGVVGQFNAGKTLLLGSLIGFADGLPVSEIPTTGNVTALYFTPVEEVTTTTFRSFTVEYLDNDGARECLSAMLAQAGQTAQAARLRPDLQERLAGFNPDDKDTLATLDKWCGEAWAASHDPNLRSLLRELVWFLRAYFRCGPGMCNSPPRAYQVAPETAREGLALPVPEELQSLAFADLPPPPRAITAAPVDLTADDLRATFPLIRRVRVDVHVSRAVWDLSAVSGSNQFVLLDFPGLGAAFTGVRDRYLCLRELREVQTLLIMLNSDRPGEAAWGDLIGAMRKAHAGLTDAILVGVGRFDRLPLGNDGMEKLKRLAGSGGATASATASTSSVFDDEDSSTPGTSEYLTEQAIRDQLPVLKTCLAVAETLVPADRKDRIVLLSPLLSLKLLADAETRLQVGSGRFLADLAGDARAGLEVRKLWKAVAERLGHDNKGCLRRPGLARWLDDFAADGGIGRLRELIQSHVQVHGLHQLFEDVFARGQALRTELQKLAGLLAPLAQGADMRTPPDLIQSVRERFNRLADFYRQLILKVRQSPSLLVECDGKGTPVAEMVERETVHQVYEWDHWDTLFQAAAGGYIAEAGPATLGGAGGGNVFEEGDDAEASAYAFPVRSDDFLPLFEATLARLQEYTRGQIEAGVDYWLAQQAGKVAAERQELAEVLKNPELQQEINKLRLGQRAAGLVNALRAAVDPALLKRHVFVAGDAADGGRKANASALFPLALAKGEYDPGRLFGWAKALQEHPKPDCRPGRNLAHLCQVLRLRDEFVGVLTQELSQAVSLALKNLTEKLLNVLKDLNTKLAVVAGNEPVLDTLLQKVPGRDGKPKAASDDPLIAVRHLASIPWPLGA